MISMLIVVDVSPSGFFAKIVYVLCGVVIVGIPVISPVLVSNESPSGRGVPGAK